VFFIKKSDRFSQFSRAFFTQNFAHLNSVLVFLKTKFHFFLFLPFPLAVKFFLGKVLTNLKIRFIIFNKKKMKAFSFSDKEEQK
jgi:hypothetical protein